MRHRRLRAFIRAALIAALIAVAALIELPIGPVPVTLQLLVVAVATLVLTPAEAALALGLYLAAGAFGAPVFSGGGGGVGMLLGPTGGFLIGFLLGSVLGASVRALLFGEATRVQLMVADIAGLVTLLAATYATGWAWLAHVTHTSAAHSFALAVAPFLLVDVVKIAVALIVARALRASGALS
jgi:biotin transport system substrate-specific component